MFKSTDFYESQGLMEDKIMTRNSIMYQIYLGTIMIPGLSVYSAQCIQNEMLN